MIDFYNSHITGMTARANGGDVSDQPAHRHKASLDIFSSSYYSYFVYVLLLLLGILISALSFESM